MGQERMKAMSKKDIGRRPLLAAGAAAGLSAVLPSLSTAQIRPEGLGMAGDLTAEEIVRLLDLQPNATCGFVRVTFLSKQAKSAGRNIPRESANGISATRLWASNDDAELVEG